MIRKLLAFFGLRCPHRDLDRPIGAVSAQWRREQRRTREPYAGVVIKFPIDKDARGGKVIAMNGRAGR